MLEPAEQKKISAVIKTDWFIYFAFVDAVIMYVVVTYIVTRSGTPEGSQPDTLRGGADCDIDPRRRREVLGTPKAG